MKPCKHCKTEVSPNAKTCPHCGEPNPARKTVSFGTFVFFFMIGFFFLAAVSR